MYYNQVKTPVYKVEYYIEKEDGTYELYTEKTGIKASAGEEVEAEIITIDGYEHTIISESNEKDTVKEDDSTVLKVYYNKVEDPVYKVQYFIEKEDGTYELYEEKTDIKGKAGEEAEAEIITIDGYVHIQTNESNEKDVIKADSSTVIKVYYNIEEETTPEETTPEETTPEETTPEETTPEETTPEETTPEETTPEETTPEETTPEETTPEENKPEETTEKLTTKETTTQQSTTKAPNKIIKTGDSWSDSLFVMLISAITVVFGCFLGRKKTRE